MADPADPTVELPTRDGYDLWSHIYDDEDNPLIILETEHIDRLFGNVGGLRVLDVGCGTGRHALALARAGAVVTAIDFSTGMLAKARAKSGADGIRFVQHDVQTDFPFASEEFDRVVCGLMVDHIDDLVQLFCHVARVSKPDAVVVVTVMHPALMLRGVQARFTDPVTGQLTRPASQRHQVSDYVMAAVQSDMLIEHIGEHMVDEALAARSPRARRYLDWPLLLTLKLRRGSARASNSSGRAPIADVR